MRGTVAGIEAMVETAARRARKPRGAGARDGALLALVAAGAFAALERERLRRDLDASRRALSDSRARLVTVADRERRRIERDLHDGAQQRLVALQIKLALLRERLEDEASTSAEAVRELEDEVETAGAEVRELAHGVFPPLLGEHGLRAALEAVARDAALPTSVRASELGRYHPEVERAVYFACTEALQNAAKHARGATRVTISLSEDGALRFEVRDDGAGFAACEGGDGAGLANLHDRLAVVGGELDVESSPGAGTRVAGRIPVR